MYVYYTSADEILELLSEQQVLPASSSEFLSVSVVASLFIKQGKKTRSNCFLVIPSQCSAQDRIQSRPVMAGVQL